MSVLSDSDILSLLDTPVQSDDEDPINTENVLADEEEVNNEERVIRIIRHHIEDLDYLDVNYNQDYDDESVQRHILSTTFEWRNLDISSVSTETQQETSHVSLQVVYDNSDDLEDGPIFRVSK